MILLEILIALSFVYLSAATFCSLLHEWIASHSLARAKMLRDAIERMLGTNTTLALYSHPMVDTVCETHLRPPSYLPSATFARALLDSLRSAKSWAEPLKIEDVRKALDQISHLPLRDALASLCGAAGTDVTVLEKGIAEWFDQVMDRTTGWYKRHARGMLFLIGFATAAAFNLDTFRIVSRLWSDAALRTQLVAAGEKRVKDNAADLTLEQAKLSLDTLPFGWNATFPSWQDLTTFAVWSRNIAALERAFLSGFFGWLVTALAVSLGAPFWFDLLKRVVDLRGVGKKPKPSSKTGDVQ